MRAMIRLAFLLAACWGGLAWQAAARAEYLVMEAGLKFPDRLGSATQTRSQRYPQPGLGHGIDYSGQNYGGSIYVYDRGVSDISDGIDAAVVRSEFARARSDIFAVQKQQNLPEPVLIGERTIRVNGIAFLTASYRYMRNNQETYSVVAVTGYRRHFVKLRISTLASSGQAGAAEIDDFIQSVGRLLLDSSVR